MKKRLHYLCKDGVVKNLSLVMPNGDLQYEFLSIYLSVLITETYFQTCSLVLVPIIFNTCMHYVLWFWLLLDMFIWVSSNRKSPAQFEHRIKHFFLSDSHFIINHRALITESTLAFPDIAERSFLHIRALIFMITNISRSIHYTL